MHQNDQDGRSPEGDNEYRGPERRSDEHAAIRARLDQGDERMGRMEERLTVLEISLAANTEATKEVGESAKVNGIAVANVLQKVEEIAKNTSGLVAVQQDVENASKILCRIAMAGRYVLETVERYKISMALILGGGYFLLFGKLPDWVFKAFKLAF